MTLEDPGVRRKPCATRERRAQRLLPAPRRCSAGPSVEPRDVYHQLVRVVDRRLNRPQGFGDPVGELYAYIEDNDLELIDLGPTAA